MHWGDICCGCSTVPLLPQVYHEMVLLEQIHSMPELSQAASMQAVTSRPLKLH